MTLLAMTQVHHGGVLIDAVRRNTPPHSSADSNEGMSAKPRFSPRTSSLNLPTKFSASSSSLNLQRSFPSSGLKQEVLSTPDIRSPQTVLCNILGENILEENGTEGSVGYVAQRPSSLAADIAFGNLSLTSFAGQDQKTQDISIPFIDGSRVLDNDQYQMRVGEFDRLKQSVDKCNSVLEMVETSLSGFQTDLGNVSSEIENLQDRSTMINAKLQRRRTVEARLGPAVEALTIPPRTVAHLSEGPIDAAWIAALADLDKRLTQLTRGAPEMRAQEAAMDMQPLLENLRDRTVERARDYLVAQVKALRSPNVNAQIIQQRALIRHKDLFSFLTKHHPQLADDIRQAYSNTMRWYYEANFGRYKQALERLSLYVFGRQDALGSEWSNTKGSAHGANAAAKAPNPWSVGHRSVILTNHKDTALSAQVAQNMNVPCFIETPFHAFTTAIAENASAEYAFLAAFFAESTSPSVISKTFHGIYAPVFDMGFDFTKRLINDTVDCIGLLLCVRITQQQAFALQRKKCPVTESWTNGTNMLLWPRFQVSMDVHIDSVRHMASLPSNVVRPSLSLTMGRPDDNKGSVAPHPVTQRFGQFLQGLLALSNRDGFDIGPGSVFDGGPAAVGSDLEPVSRSLQRLRNEMETLLFHLSQGFSQSRRARFLANNYSLVLTIIAESGGNFAQEQREWINSKIDETGSR